MERSGQGVIRKIIHIDMDSFYVSVEQRDNPSLRGKAVVVGHSGRRGVVATASYEARKYGVHSAMSSAVAKRLCPHLIFVDADFRKYKEVSRQIHEVFREYTDLIEPISLDEAFLDVTHNKAGIAYAKDIAIEIKQKIKERTGLTASAGVSYCKLLAKIASDWNKPDGLFVVHPSKALDFIAALDIEKIWGIGPVTAERLHSMGIYKGIHLRNASVDVLARCFGKMGRLYRDFACGIDPRPVEPLRVRKSVGCEVTLESDICDSEDVHRVLQELSDDLEQRIERAGFRGYTLTLKVKFHDFAQITRSHSEASPFLTAEKIYQVARDLVDNVSYFENPVRLLGLSVSNPVVEKNQQYIQLTLDFAED